jgi:hypothetical protein
VKPVYKLEVPATALEKADKIERKPERELLG